MTAENSEAIQQDYKVKRVFLKTLQEQRSAIYQRMLQFEESDSISAFVFDLLTRLAKSGKKRITSHDISTINEQLGRLSRSAAEIPLRLDGGVVISLEQALTFSAPPPSTKTLLNAFFARGFALYLEPKSSTDRKSFTAQVVKLLPGIERLGSFLLSDFVDFACTEEDALRFWQFYVERVASELGRRTAEQEEEADTWMLSSLLRLHLEGPSSLAGRRWELLRKHIERIVQCGQDKWRWRFLRVLTEACQDPRILYLMFTSPSIVEDDEVPFVFLTRCNSKLISCVLFMFQVCRSKRRLITNMLEYFEQRSLAEVGERIVEIYAQTQLIERPNVAIQVIMEGLLSIVREKLKSESVDVVLNAIKNDARAFRQNLLLLHILSEGRVSTSPTQIQCLERVIQSFFHSFTPSGVRHPLNDHVYNRAVKQTIVELMRTELSDQASNLRSFALSLPRTAQRWLPDEEDAPKRRLLLSYFIGMFANVLRDAGRSLYKRADTKTKALELYRILLELYIEQPNVSFESGGYGALNPLLPSLFPEMISREYEQDQHSPRLQEVTELFAKIEAEQYYSDGLDGLLSQWKERYAGRDIVEVDEEEEAAKLKVEVVEDELEISEIGSVPIVTQQPVKAQVVDLGRPQTKTQSALATYLGIDTLKFVIKKVLGLLGIHSHGHLSLIGDQIIFQKVRAQGNSQVLSHEELRFHVSQLAGVRVYKPLRGFYLVFGILSLVTLSFAGGHFLFAGVRGSEMGLGFLGVGLILFGFITDAAMSVLHRRGSEHIILELVRHQETRPLALGINSATQAGEALLNAFMAQDAHIREETFNQDWVDLAIKGYQERIEADSSDEGDSGNSEEVDEAEEPSTDQTLSNKEQVDEQVSVETESSNPPDDVVSVALEGQDTTVDKPSVESEIAGPEVDLVIGAKDED